MFCPKCGCEYRDGFSVCNDCGENLIVEKPKLDEVSIFASLYRRFSAFLIDSTLVSCIVLLILFLNIKFNSIEYNTIIICILFIAFLIIPFWLYYSIMESSKYRGTIGKIIFKVTVSDYKGNRISFRKASIRTFSKLLSSILFFGYILAIVSTYRQSLHDSIAGTIVINKGNESKVNILRK